MSHKEKSKFQIAKSRLHASTGSGSLLSNLQYSLGEHQTLTRSLHHDIRETVKEIYVKSLK